MITPAEIAKQLIAAERERVAIAPFTDANPELDIATAYLAQRAFVQAKLDAGEQVVGAKLGLTSKVKQHPMGVDAPLSGVVTSGMLAPFGVPIQLSEFIHPRVEPEIAFVLARDVAVAATVASVLAATESVHGAIDVLDSRYGGLPVRLARRHRRQRERRSIPRRTPLGATGGSRRSAPARVCTPCGR